MIGTSCRTSWRWMTSGAIRADTPRMNSTLKMLLPTTLPTAMSLLPWSTAPTETAVSGALVPKATTVRPTTSGEMPKETASLAAPRTSSEAPATRAISPRMKKTRLMAPVSVGRAPARQRREYRCRAGGRGPGAFRESEGRYNT